MDPLENDPGGFAEDYWVLLVLGKLRRALTQKYHALKAGKIDTVDTPVDLALAYERLVQADRSIRQMHGLDPPGVPPDWVGVELSREVFRKAANEL